MVSQADHVSAPQAVARGLGIQLNKDARLNLPRDLSRLYWAHMPDAESTQRNTTQAGIPLRPGKLVKLGEVDMMHRRVGGVAIDLVELVRLVKRCGGPQVVTESRGWLSLGITLGVPSDGRSRHAATSTRLRTLYNYAVEQLRRRRADCHLLHDSSSNVDAQWLGKKQLTDDGCRQSQDLLNDLSRSDSDDDEEEDNDEDEGWEGWGEGSFAWSRKMESEKCKAEEWKRSLVQRRKTCEACRRTCAPSRKTCPWCSASFVEAAIQSETGLWTSASWLRPQIPMAIDLEGDLDPSLLLPLPLVEGGSALHSGDAAAQCSGGRGARTGHFGSPVSAWCEPGAAAGNWPAVLSDVPASWLPPPERDGAGLRGLGNSLFSPWVHIER